tara:strand:- start:739 stop:1263 length:525 start_codon:yes stop_codon:yes gene_type:complete
MTSKILTDILKSNKLPKDELDGFVKNFIGGPLGPIVLSLVALSLFMDESSDSMLRFLFLSVLWLVYNLFMKYTERNITRISTGESAVLNRKIIAILKAEYKLVPMKSFQNYSEFEVPLVFGFSGHKLTLIAVDNEILFNLRNIGSLYRAPYFFGIDTYKTWGLITRIKELADQK